MSSLYESRWATSAPFEPGSKPVAQLDAKEDKSSTPSALSGAATTFQPLPQYAQDVIAYDSFEPNGAYADDTFYGTAESMQTRPQDDLFADDFTPAPEPTLPEPVAAAASVKPSENREATQTASRSRGRGRGRGRGQVSRQESDKHRPEDSPAQQAPPENAPTGPKKDGVPAVRGDRQATGGVRKPKLSEAELVEKMAQISVKNASLAAAHARAEADAASFADREAQAKVAASKRDEISKARIQSERKDRQQMMGEREKNRVRKLKAMEGREWDAEKKEDDFSKGGRYDGKGFAGDNVDYSDGREYLLREPTHHASRSSKDTKPAREGRPPKRDEFPALPTASAVNQPSSMSFSATEINVKSWAEQVEASSGA